MVNLTEEQEREIIALYSDPDTRLLDIKKTYSIGDSIVYRILHKHGIKPNRNPGGGPKRIKKPEEVRSGLKFRTDVSEDAIRDAFGHTQYERVVTVDKTDTVQSIAKVERKKNCVTWKIEFSGTLMIPAESIFEALNEAKKLPMVQRIIGANIAELGKE